MIFWDRVCSKNIKNFKKTIANSGNVIYNSKSNAFIWKLKGGESDERI